MHVKRGEIGGALLAAAAVGCGSLVSLCGGGSVLFVLLAGMAGSRYEMNK